MREGSSNAQQSQVLIRLVLESDRDGVLLAVDNIWKSRIV